MSEEPSATEQAPAHIPAAPAGAPGYEPAQEAWETQDDELSELPPRPRRRLLTPLPLALAAVLLIACGFVAGVLVEKGQTSSSAGGSASGAGAIASRLRALTGAGGGAGGASAQGFARPASGTVSFVSGSTLYISGLESNTVKVRTSAATTVTKSVRSSVHDIHPGETVTVTGSTSSDGTVDAEAIRVGGGAAGGLGALFGGASGNPGGGSSGAAGESAGKGTSGGGAVQLFGNG